MYSFRKSLTFSVILTKDLSSNCSWRHQNSMDGTEVDHAASRRLFPPKNMPDYALTVLVAFRLINSTTR